MPFIVEQFTSVMSEAFFSLLEIQIDSLLTSIVETVLKNSIQKKGKKKKTVPRNVCETLDSSTEDRCLDFLSTRGVPSSPKHFLIKTPMCCTHT